MTSPSVITPEYTAHVDYKPDGLSLSTRLESSNTEVVTALRSFVSISAIQAL